MYMKNVYCIAYPPGMFGEFLCTQITKDSNYHPNLCSSTPSPLNKYKFRSVLDHLIWVTLAWSPVPDSVKMQISKRYSDKHVLIRSHCYDETATLNIDRLIKVKFYCDQDQWLLSFLLWVIKSYPVTINHGDVGIGEMSDSWMYPVIYESNKFPEYNQLLFDNIRNVTYLEIELILRGFRNCRELIEQKIADHKSQASISSGSDNWIYLNPYKLLIEPEKEMSQWRSAFDLTQDFDFDLLRSYHNANLTLIQQEFGQSFEELLQGDYVTEVTNYCENMRNVFK